MLVAKNISRLIDSFKNKYQAIDGKYVTKQFKHTYNEEATYLQMNGTHNTHWSDEYSFYITFSYMCI